MNRTVQWLNSNKYRAYPVVEDVVAVFAEPSGVGRFELPDSLLLDFQLTAYATLAGAVQLRSIWLTHAESGLGELHLEFSAGAQRISELVVPENAAEPHIAQQRTAAYTLDAALGPGVASLAQSLAAYPDGTVFTCTAPVPVEPALVGIQDRHRVASIVGDAPGSVAVSGRVYWEAGYNVILDLDTAARLLRIHAVPGAGAGFPCGRTGTQPDCMAGLFALNGVYADAFGRIGLVGGAGFDIIPEPELHRITIRPAVAKADIDCGNK